ncbi:hypothetical protein [Gordonia neofelifaecis]|nr:hypothetical protein [Gordonia neofelifaecis]
MGTTEFIVAGILPVIAAYTDAGSPDRLGRSERCCCQALCHLDILAINALG